MKFEFIKEPRLQFSGGTHICPKKGISAYGVYDKDSLNRCTSIGVGAIGSNHCLETLDRWLKVCENYIDSPEATKQPNLFSSFCGFNSQTGFYSKFIYNDDLARSVRNADIEDILLIKDKAERIEKAVKLYYEEAKFLAQNRRLDVIVCVLPKKIYDAVTSHSIDEDTLDASISVSIELNFRRALKAKAMHLGKPLQLVRAESLELGVKGQQDTATKAWNFCTALYYKAGATNPWKLATESTSSQSCALGIAFYKSRDRQVLHTSLAQIFDELGNGLILRGTPVQVDKNDRIPRLTANQAYELFTAALEEYRIALRNYPARVVVHKSSNYTNEEMEGLRQAARDLRIDTVDFVTVLDSKIRIFRDGNYPPFRGSMISLDHKKHLLYTRGSVWFYKTYPGMYIPNPLELRIVHSEKSPLYLAKEILSLTKMNWNNTQLDGKYPVTLGCARKVGEIMKYLDEGERPQIRYGFYM